MNRYLGVFVALIAFTTAVVIGTSRYKTKSFEAERDLNLVRIQKDYLERVDPVYSGRAGIQRGSQYLPAVVFPGAQ